MNAKAPTERVERVRGAIRDEMNRSGPYASTSVARAVLAAAANDLEGHFGLFATIEAACAQERNPSTLAETIQDLVAAHLRGDA